MYADAVLRPEPGSASSVFGSQNPGHAELLVPQLFTLTPFFLVQNTGSS